MSNKKIEIGVKEVRYKIINVKKSTWEYLKECFTFKYIRFNTPDEVMLTVLKISRYKTKKIHKGDIGYDDIDSIEYIERDSFVKGYLKPTGDGRFKFIRIYE